MKDLQKITLLILLSALPTAFLKAQSGTESKTDPSICLGAYYFDGWTGLTKHLTPELANNFPERTPIWGWVTSKQEIMEDQIELASNAGISFFSFCWYFTNLNEYRMNPRNHALSLFLEAKNKDKLKFNLLVANHAPYVINPSDWKDLCAYWVTLFKNPLYIQVNGCPLISFFNTGALVKSFGSPAAVKLAFWELRELAKDNGLKGVAIAAVVGPENSSIQLSTDCGYDLVTGYNYHESGFSGDGKSFSIDKLINGSTHVWESFKKYQLPLIPVVTANWDPRPWPLQYKTSPVYTGYGEQSVERATRNVKRFIEDNPKTVTKERIALIYAWNEYGEGAWLTPSKPLKDSLLNGVRNGLR